MDESQFNTCATLGRWTNIIHNDHGQIVGKELFASLHGTGPNNRVHDDLPLYVQAESNVLYIPPNDAVQVLEEGAGLLQPDTERFISYRARLYCILMGFCLGPALKRGTIVCPSRYTL